MIDAPFRLIQPGTILVEHLRPSGFKRMGNVDFYVFDETHNITSMLVRVLAKAPAKTESVAVGSVYVTKVYRDQLVHFDGEEHRIMNARDLEAELEGYDDSNLALYDRVEDEGFPVCGKA